jgi:hypothetical protein
MQQIFCCPTCGAQNVVGQEFCQSCGQPFQYNCPFCGAIVDSKFVNCPKCRESLNWPTPQKIKPFPKQPVAYQRGGGGGVGMGVGVGGEVGEGGEKAKKKSDPWLTGCLGLVIIAFLVLGAYFLYDYFFKEKPATVPQLPSYSREEIAFKPMQSPGFETFSDSNEV